MKESYWGYWILIFGIFIMVILMLINSFTSTNSEDYLLMREAAEASMTEAVDYAYYRNEGELRINSDKFVENFLRRFAESINTKKTYQIDFYAIYEAPPKISIKIKTNTNSFNIAGDAESLEVVSKISSILELKPSQKDPSDIDDGSPKCPGECIVEEVMEGIE